MAHPRKLVRQVAVGMLKTAATPAGDRVISSKMVPWKPSELPGISLYILDEDVDAESAQSAPRQLLRTADLVIIGAVRHTGPQRTADDLDDLAEEIENAIDADPSFGGITNDAVLTKTSIGIPEEGSTELGMIRLVYSVSYWRYSLENKTLDDFKTATVKYNLGGTQAPADQAQNLIEDLDL